MKLLITNDELHEVRGGTQVFAAELARALRARGHQVAVYSWLRGSLAGELQRAGIAVVGNPGECGFVPDLIHGQHHLATLAALCAFPGVPAIYHCHGYSPWQERPPRHPRILRYVTTSEAMTGWISSVCGCAREEILILRNSIDLTRFAEVRRLGLHPRRALLFGNSFMPPEFISRLAIACRRRGLTLDRVGAPFGNATPAPESVLPHYDLVFAVGRSALEAAASGCAVIPFNANGIAPPLGPANFAAFARANFTVPEPRRPVSVGDVERRIRQVDAGQAAAVTAMVRDGFSLDGAVTELIDFYSAVLDSVRDLPMAKPDDELAALAEYIGSLGPLIKGADERQAKLRAARDQSRRRSARLKQRLNELQSRMNRIPGFLRRWFIS